MWYNRPVPISFIQYRVKMYKVVFLVLAAAPAEAWTPANPAAGPPFNFTDFVLLLGEFFNAERKVTSEFQKKFLEVLEKKQLYKNVKKD